METKKKKASTMQTRRYWYCCMLSMEIYPASFLAVSISGTVTNAMENIPAGETSPDAIVVKSRRARVLNRGMNCQLRPNTCAKK